MTRAGSGAAITSDLELMGRKGWFAAFDKDGGLADHVAMELQVEWPWRGLLEREERQGLQQQLDLEIGRGHDLWQTGAKIVARSDADDDVMAMLNDGRYAIVHLTWNTNSGDARWPHTRIFLTAEDARRAAFDGTRHNRE